MKVQTGGYCSEKGRLLRQFWSDVGPTDGCRACIDPAGRQHSALCRKRRAEWEAARGKRPGAPLEEVPPPLRRRTETGDGIAVPVPIDEDEEMLQD
eukprot:1452166-Heterocapsa_arctica.AAC.1